MLGKLMKHEFRATARIMLPVMGAMVALALLANLSIRGLAGNLSDVPLLRILFVLIIIFFSVAVVATAVMSLVIMVSRFYRNLLKETGVSEKRLAAVLRVTNLDDVEFDEEGKLKETDRLKENIRKEWGDFITTTETKGADTETPPGGAGGADGTHAPSRAAQIVQKRYERMYGKQEGDN